MRLAAVLLVVVALLSGCEVSSNDTTITKGGSATVSCV